MTNHDYNAFNGSAKQICNSAMNEIFEIKKTNLSLHNGTPLCVRAVNRSTKLSINNKF